MPFPQSSIRRARLAAGLLGLALLVPAAHAAAPGQVLEDYVRRPDPAFRWELKDSSWGLLADLHRIRLVSQQWLDAGKVDRPAWVHDLYLTQPRALCGDTARTSPLAVLIISGGRNEPDGEPRPIKSDRTFLAGLMAQTFCRPVFELRQVPNQPLRFTGHDQGRKEDGILAWSMDRYLRASEGDWPAHMAMAKSVVQAMTAAQAFSRTRDDVPDVTSFVLIGTSKRGWTSWLTASVDPRVAAIVPVSIDMLNMPVQFEHHRKAYGHYATALADYDALDMACLLRGPRGTDLRNIIDPFALRERVKVPKLILNSAGDEYFLPDSWRFYFDDLPGPKRLRYTVNTDHGQGEANQHRVLFEQARNWIDDLAAGREPPRLDWSRPTPDTLVVRPSVAPREVRLWTADNPKARDFRLETIGPAWTARTLQADAAGAFRAKLEPPKEGWRAVLVEAVFGGADAGRQQIYTTGVYVMPDSYPHTVPACREG
ncbi:MAG TPA: PhoPQ-activated protein PqaA family protein [Nevskiaceae bacterium]|nr:PhoPQ-activated protein PqaA family protein [Nevskiaceae bacterium]